MTSEEKIARLGDAYDAKWAEVQRLTEEAIEGRAPLEVVCAAIVEACKIEAALRCEQVRHAAESYRAAASK